MSEISLSTGSSRPPSAYFPSRQGGFPAQSGCVCACVWHGRSSSRTRYRRWLARSSCSTLDHHGYNVQCVSWLSSPPRIRFALVDTYCPTCSIMSTLASLAHHRDPVEPFRRRGLSSHSQLGLFGQARSTWFAAETWCGQGRTVAQGRRGIASCQIDHSCWRRIGPIAIDMYEWTIAVDATESVVRDCMSKWIDFSWWRSMVDVSRWRGGMDIVR